MASPMKFIEDRPDIVRRALARYRISESGCWIFQGGINPGGYGVVGLKSGTRTLHCAAHRLAYAFSFGADPGEQFVCHRCDTRACINPAHLFLGSRQDNIDDMVQKGRKASLAGERNSRCKLTDSMVEEIVGRIVKGEGNSEIARAYPVSHAQVSEIRRGRGWRHITLRLGYEPEAHVFFRHKKSA